MSGPVYVDSSSDEDDGPEDVGLNNSAEPNTQSGSAPDASSGVIASILLYNGRRCVLATEMPLEVETASCMWKCML